MKKNNHEAPPKSILWFCLLIIYGLYRISIATDNVVFLYLSAIPGLIVIVVYFDGMLNHKK